MNTKKQIPKAGETAAIEKCIHLTENGSFHFFDCDMSAYDGCGAFVGKSEISFVMPDGNPIEAMVNALQEQIKTKRANHHVKITQLEDKIQQLLAIGHDGGIAQ